MMGRDRELLVQIRVHPFDYFPGGGTVLCSIFDVGVCAAAAAVVDGDGDDCCGAPPLAFDDDCAALVDDDDTDGGVRGRQWCGSIKMPYE
mmetsp:Transcript_36774/g.80501  ORF Transcript_36774/g.80501 Transcript_36774/m.80501 type:complete len:90 (+) Transcript_36774:1104-1373(+)